VSRVVFAEACLSRACTTFTSRPEAISSDGTGSRRAGQCQLGVHWLLLVCI
jgi:hypothetical protein